MHKGQIFLTKASDRDEAISNVREFLDEHQDRVWDWYVIGGRWSGNLNPKSEEFYKLAEAHFKKMHPDMGEFLTSSMISESAEVLQSIWSEELGQQSENPYTRDSYSSDGNEDDILPLTECENRVKDWAKDLKAVAQENWDKMLASKKENGQHDLSAYYANRYAEAVYDEYCFDTNTYDIDNQTNDVLEALENANEYFAVMVDIHN